MVVASANPNIAIDFGGSDGQGRDVLALVCLLEDEELLSLVTILRDDPARARLEAKLGFPLQLELVAELFAVVIFLSDGLLQVKTDYQQPSADKMVRFLIISQQLPMELQMLLCHRVFDSNQDNITSIQAETGFKQLADSYLITKAAS